MIFDMKQPPPHGSKSLARHDLPIGDLSSEFGERETGASKATWGSQARAVFQLVSLRMGRMSRFAAVGALGTVVNLLVMALLVHAGFNVGYVVAAVVAAEISILHNFVLQERFVFRDMRDGDNSLWNRLAQHLLFNNAEVLVRLPILMLLVETMHVLALLAQAITLAIAFIARFLFVSRVVYRPKPVALPAPSARAESR
ncbi:GtrA family protein [Arthrobacter sp. Z1-9]